jgi:AcrR family transcriptional regulator
MTETARRLMDATTALLVEQGPGATTLRAITDRAGANVAAVGYHFGSKDALVSQAYAAILDEVTGIQLARLAELHEDAPLEAVVRIWVTPAFATHDGSERESAMWSAVQRGMAEQASVLLAHRTTLEAVDEQLHRRLRALLPHLSVVELHFRHAAVLAALGSLRTGALQQLLASGPDEPELRDFVVAWVVGGMRAPAVRPAE